MIIVKGVPFLLLAGKRTGTAQLSPKKGTPLTKIFKYVYVYDFGTI